MLTLYNAAHSTCSQKVRICLAEKDLPFADIRLDLGKGKDHLKPEYLKINPNGLCRRSLMMAISSPIPASSANIWTKSIRASA